MYTSGDAVIIDGVGSNGTITCDNARCGKMVRLFDPTLGNIPLEMMMAEEVRTDEVLGHTVKKVDLAPWYPEDWWQVRQLPAHLGHIAKTRFDFCSWGCLMVYVLVRIIGRVWPTLLEDDNGGGN